MEHRVVGLVGASGGLGVSTLAVALAARAGQSLGVTVCVDAAGGHGARGGLDVTACLEHLPGLRWGDLEDVRGAVDGSAVVQGLPGEGSLRILASRGPTPHHDVVSRVVRAVSGVAALTVLDLGTLEGGLDLCTDVVLLAGVSARHLADAAALAASPAVADARGPVPRLLLRGPRDDQVTAEEVALHLDLPLVGVLRDDPRVRADEARARLPGGRARGALAASADRILAELEDAAGPLSAERLGA
jgi:hypothetical protein